jgi:hypothetical protein
MSMNGVTIIRCSVEQVSGYVLDVSNDKEWRYSITESGFRNGNATTPGSIGYSRVGKVEIEWKIRSFTPGEGVDWELLTGPIRGFGGYRFEAVPEGTRFTLVADVRPTGLYKLLGPIFRSMGRKRNQADVEKLRDILESTS